MILSLHLNPAMSFCVRSLLCSLPLVLGSLPVASMATQDLARPTETRVVVPYSIEVTPLGALLDDPAARAVLNRHAPALLPKLPVAELRHVTLVKLQPFVREQLTANMLAQIAIDLVKLPPKPYDPGSMRPRPPVEAPPFVAQKLRLVDLPRPSGMAYALFNGQDLNDWDGWLGYEDPSLTYADSGKQPIGLWGKGSAFQVVRHDGQPALRIDGRIWGALVHRKEIGNYHLSLEYKFTGKRYAPRLDQPENNGLLYHSGGPLGAFFGTWMRSVEFEIMPGSTGMVVPVGREVNMVTEVALDRSIAQPWLRYMQGGLSVEARWQVENARNAEKPTGEWNRLDLYTLGDQSIHVVNGEPVMRLTGLSLLDAKTGQKVPLTRGRVQFQSEGAETLFRNIIVEPIESMPTIVAERDSQYRPVQE